MATQTPLTSWYTIEGDKHQLYQRIWKPTTPTKVHLIFLHGFSDRIDHYDSFFTILTSKYPIEVHSIDRRGWGKSVHNPNQRGNTGPMAQQLEELNDYVNNTIKTSIPDLGATPLFLMGHSMGGQELTYYMLNTETFHGNDARPKISGIILEGPYIGLDAASQPPALKVIAGRLVAKLAPQFAISNPIDAEYICPDPAVQKMYTDDPLCHNMGTLECFRDMLERSKQLCDLANDPSGGIATLRNQLPCPVLWTHGTQDKATDYPVSKLLCEGLQACGKQEGDKVFKGYDGWLHQLHNQPDGGKEAYAKDVGGWILNIAGRKGE